MTLDKKVIDQTSSSGLSQILTVIQMNTQTYTIYHYCDSFVELTHAGLTNN